MPPSICLSLSLGTCEWACLCWVHIIMFCFSLFMFIVCDKIEPTLYDVFSISTFDLNKDCFRQLHGNQEQSPLKGSDDKHKLSLWR